MSAPRPTARSWFLLVLLGLIWGGAFLGVSLALTGFPPLTLAAIRIALAAGLLVGLAFLLGPGLPDTRTPRGRRIWLHCLGMALFTNAIPFSLLAWGQQHVTSGFAGITMAVVPLLVLPLAHAFVPGEALTRRKLAGFALGFTGTVLLIGPGALLSDPGAEPLARLACIAASACYATGSIVTRRAPQGPFLSFAAGGLLLAAALILPVALVVDGLPGPVPTRALLGAVYLGVFPTALATILLVHVIQTAGPSFLSLVNYQVPVWAVLIGMVALGESLPPQFLGALALILTGLAVAEARLRR
jgi:drug/metabolite transporter (DMT)-like permease